MNPVIEGVFGQQIEMSAVKLHTQPSFSESNLPFKVDLVDWANVDENFKKNIQDNYIVIYPLIPRET